MTIGMIVAFVVLKIIPTGSYLNIYAFSSVYLLSVLGIDLLLSNFDDFLQKATLFAFFFMMIFVLMNGLYTPIESMPNWARIIAYCNPPMYFVKVIRAVLSWEVTSTTFCQIFSKLLGLPFSSIHWQFLIIGREVPKISF